MGYIYFFVSGAMVTYPLVCTFFFCLDQTSNICSAHLLFPTYLQGMHKFETLLESSVDKNFDRFELYALKNIFGVPEDVDLVLPHYEALDFTIASEREQELDDELEILRRQVIAVSLIGKIMR